MAPSQGRHATRVAAGILITRLLGFVRERVFAHYFGNSTVADAFRAALRIPNAIRNLLGEGTLSASFIPVYAGMLARGEEDDARRLAGAIVSLLSVLAAGAAVVGILLAPLITAVVAPGFDPATRALTTALVQILFPMAAVFVLSAWALGVLNTHRRFFLAYAAPAMWNIVQIGTLVALGGMLVGARLSIALAFGALAGSVAQFVIQLPAALRCVGRLVPSLDRSLRGVSDVIRAWIPVVLGAGVVQIASIIDTQLGSLLGAGAVAVLGYAQLVALLPISLFGVSVASAALPELSRDAALADHDVLRTRLAEAGRRIAYFVVPSALAFATLPVPIIGTLFQTGRFDATDTEVAAGVLAAYSIGVLAQASVKLFASGFYALGDTRTPVKIAALSMAVGAGLGAALMQLFGPAGIALGAAIGAWLNVGLLTRALGRRIGPVVGRSERAPLAVVLMGGVAAAGAGWGIAAGLATQPVALIGAAALTGFGLVYGLVTYVLGHPEARQAMASVRGKSRE